MSSLPSALKHLFSYIDDHKTEYINNLKEAVAIKSVSAWPDHRNEIIKMMKWVEVRLKNLGPALKEDGWDTEPFTLVEKNGKLFGRGSTDDKGPVLCWIHALQAYKAIGIDIPVNLKGMEESGSEGLDELLWIRKDTFFQDVDYVCISDNYWLGTKKPCITYGLRGICYFQVEVTCAIKDLHSGTFGGTLHEAMADLIYLLNTLVDVNGKILIDGIYDTVVEILKKEIKYYNLIYYYIIFILLHTLLINLIMTKLLGAYLYEVAQL
ncbi:Cytosolic non-specific dipeptidase [Melipona quadrifasciata]|uniref:Cytosolic non-specific dipeptidase n=1 Tax=Melipona quadrifasciata TaxID=166423 RepID=A0A0N0BEG2_9HYME|nr:Cytosolic non-specific dipeptidase [Melipona quadrifasciata]